MRDLPSFHAANNSPDLHIEMASLFGVVQKPESIVMRKEEARCTIRNQQVKLKQDETVPGSDEP